MYKSVYLKKGKEESLRRFHPWVFSGAIARMDDGLEEGDVVRVIGFDGSFLGVGHVQVGSIAVRILSFHDVAIDDDFWQSRLAAAWQVRQSIGIYRTEEASFGGEHFSQGVNTTYRLVHGEGDNLPGLVIDCYGKTAVMQAHSVGMHVSRMAIAKALKEVMGDRLEHVYYKSETTLPFKANLGQENEFILGGPTDEDLTTENGLRFHVDWLRGQKTGFFVDQRENRALLEHYAKGRTVLNMFCYTGGFSVYAMRGGASQVHSVDSSAKAVELTNANVALNFPPEDHRHEAFCEDAFKYLDSHDDKYDLIILLRQAPWRAAQRPQGLYAPQRQGISAYPQGWHPLHFQLLAGGQQGAFPPGGVHGGSPGRTQGAHSPPAAPARRPPHQHLPSRGRISQGPRPLRGVRTGPFETKTLV